VSLPGGDDLVIARPRDPAALLDEERFAAQDEFLPYWADLWPSARALARVLATRRLGGMRVLELGCGLALPSLVAARGGARACATDWRRRPWRPRGPTRSATGSSSEGLVVDWRAPDALVAGRPGTSSWRATSSTRTQRRAAARPAAAPGRPSPARRPGAARRPPASSPRPRERFALTGRRPTPAIVPVTVHA
jgi:hypothetical protein